MLSIEDCPEYIHMTREQLVEELIDKVSVLLLSYESESLESRIARNQSIDSLKKIMKTLEYGF